MQAYQQPRLWISFVALFGLALSVLVFPRSRWSRVAHRRVGPRLDAAHLTRGACLRAAGAFLTLGVGGLAAGLLATGPVTRALGAEAAMALFFIYTILGLVGIGGALYLLVRAPFRPSAIPSVHRPAEAVALKTYSSSFGEREALVLRCAADDFRVEVSDLQAGVLVPSAALGPWQSLEEAEQAALVATHHLPAGTRGV